MSESEKKKTFQRKTGVTGRVGERFQDSISLYDGREHVVMEQKLIKRKGDSELLCQRLSSN